MSSHPYVICTDVKFAPLQVVDVGALAAKTVERWLNQTLCEVNDCVVRAGVVQGDFHWHKHDLEDEFFYVVEGRFVIEFEGRTVELTPRQGFTVPRGVMHRTRAPVRSVILMVEGRGVVPTGDAVVAE
jgi:mannose-6-phosphate isomerase-like protein (cupin superfamily)